MNLRCPNCNTVFEVDESHYSALVEQVRTAEFEAELNRRLDERRQLENATLKSRLAEKERDAEKRIAEKDKEIARLQSNIDSADARHRLELADQRALNAEELGRCSKLITELNLKLETQTTAAKNRELELQKSHDILIKAKDEEIERYRDLKSRLSTKMLGETLEQHCYNTFNLARSNGLFAGSYFEKDNDATSGTKGDFIFRDYIEGSDTEYISIMFEMKNEADTTATKHRNEDFLAKLDKDRNEKKCEYAVLVSTLEADSELYNAGIVDVSYRYQKMFVVRPQCFVPIIGILSKASRQGALTLRTLRSELAQARMQSVDVSKFEEKRNKFLADFTKYAQAHNQKQAEALEAIDKAIASAERHIDQLRKAKELFATSAQKLVRAGEVIEQDLTIKKLTHGNPTMKKLFDAIAAEKE